MPKYKLVIVVSKCETVSEKRKSKVLLYPCFCLEFIAQSGRYAKNMDKFSLNLQRLKKPNVCLTGVGLLQHWFVLMPPLRPRGSGNCHAWKTEIIEKWLWSATQGPHPPSSDTRRKVDSLPMQASYSCDYASSVCSLHIASI